MFFMFVQLAIISIFKSYPTVGDIALYMAFLPVWSHLYRCKFFVFVSSLEWERACPIIVTTKANQGCLLDFSGDDTVSNMSVGLGLKLVEEGIFTCTLSPPFLQVVLKMSFFTVLHKGCGLFKVHPSFKCFTLCKAV